MMMHWAQKTCATHVHCSAREGSACLGSGQQEHQRRCNSQDFFAQGAMPLLCKPTLLSGQLRSAMQCFSCCVGQEGHLLPSQGPMDSEPQACTQQLTGLQLAQCIINQAVPLLFSTSCGTDAQRQHLQADSRLEGLGL